MFCGLDSGSPKCVASFMKNCAGAMTEHSSSAGVSSRSEGERWESSPGTGPVDDAEFVPLVVSPLVAHRGACL